MHEKTLDPLDPSEFSAIFSWSGYLIWASEHMASDPGSLICEMHGAEVEHLVLFRFLLLSVSLQLSLCFPFVPPETCRNSEEFQLLSFFIFICIFLI